MSGPAVKALRMREGLTILTWSRRSGIDVGTISRIERGERPLLASACRLAAVLGGDAGSELLDLACDEFRATHPPELVERLVAVGGRER
jgi:transcriptional regulator with XRE-family HTH domain